MPHTAYARIAIPLVVVALAAAILLWRTVGWADNDETALPPAMRAALVEATQDAGFTPLLPSHLPTSADRLVHVSATGGPNPEPSGPIELVYMDDEPSEVDESAAPSSLELFQLPTRLAAPNGEPFAPDLAGFEVHRDVVSADADGNPLKVTYTARTNDRTLVMVFTGDQPDEDGLRRMLESLEPLGP